MQADNITQLFDFEGNLERGFQSWLAARQLDASIGGAIVTLDEDYIGFTVEIGATTEHTAQLPNGQIEYDQYAFTVAVEIRTRRNDSTASQTPGVEQRHRELVALMRLGLSPSQTRGGAINPYLPYNEIQFLDPNGTSYETGAMDYDITTLNYAGQFSILPDAWPA